VGFVKGLIWKKLVALLRDTASRFPVVIKATRATRIIIGTATKTLSGNPMLAENSLGGKCNMLAASLAVF
jgi:hypothetical protein